MLKQNKRKSDKLNHLFIQINSIRVLTVLSGIVEEALHARWQEGSVRVDHVVAIGSFEVNQTRPTTAGRWSGRSVARQMIANATATAMLLR